MTPRYLIVAPPYSPDSGGSIFLHELARALNSLGAPAALWPITRRPSGDWPGRLHDVLRRPSLLWRPRAFVMAPGSDVPVAARHDLTPDSIVAYPEIVLGNPLRARNVVRWLLYRPGLRDPFQFGPDEMFFRAGEMSDLPELTGGAPDLFLWKINPVYQKEGRKDRTGACFLVRKGSDKPRIPETADAVQIDGLSHEDIAAHFNRCEVFYSYDEASFYSQYAAICGCRSVVVPGLYSSREAWVKEHPVARFGVAYGLQDLAHADATRHMVIDLLRAKEAAGLETVRRFIALTEARFTHRRGS
ncbi:hypothetical protein [Tabrizicola sp.]|uniref:hypothetical protein n=1 Tax=Tabrizicola sp. TaxID=2005166 RepID=UPI0025CC9B6C|nr:hypothetical protein [Tabrizicola sp.]